MEKLKYIFSQVNEWIRTADQKALILGSFNIAGFIYQFIYLSVTEKKDWNICQIILFTLSFVVTLVVMIFWLHIIYPRLDNKHKKSKIYFQHIANAYGENVDLGITELSKITDSDFERDLASQVVINSKIAKKKYLYIKRFIWAFSIQLIFLTLFLFSIVFN